MQRSKKAKVLTSVAAVALAASMIIGGGTYAYLQGVSDDVVNIFNANQVTVDLQETTGSEYDIIPGTSQEKDPKVTVTATVDAYVFVEVTDNTGGLVNWEIAEGWKELTGFGKTVYYREVKASDEAYEFDVIKDNEVYYDASLINEDMLDENGELKDGLELTFKAYAIQKNMDTYSNGSYKNFSNAEAYIIASTDDAIAVTTKSRAITALKYNKNVVLGADMETIKLMRTSSNGQNVYIDLNGYTVNSATSDGYAIGVENENADLPTTITIQGEGTVDGSGNSNIKQAVYAHGAGAYVVINSGTYISPDSTGELIYADAGGHITINGGTFKHSVPKWTLNLKDNSGSTIVVKGGSFWEYDPSNSTTEPGDPVSFVAKGYKVVEEERADGTWYTVVPA